MEFSALIERIYEAAALPELWPGVLADLARHSGAEAAALVLSAPGQWQGHAASAEVAEAVDRYLASNHSLHSATLPRLLAAKHPGFLTERDLFTEEAFEADPFYRHFFAPNGFHRGAATAVSLPARDVGVVQLMAGRNAPGPNASDIGRADAVRPHLARALHLASRWRLRELQAMTHALEMIGLPAAIVGSGRRVVSANLPFQALGAFVEWGADNQFRLVDERADAMLSATLERMLTQGAAATRSFPLRSSNAALAFGHVAPIVRQARDLFGHGLGLMTIAPLGRALADPDMIQSMFDLTPAEAAVAAAMLDGLSIQEIANRRGVSGETVRVQVRSILSKTGVRRQGEFVALLRTPVSPQPYGG